LIQIELKSLSLIQILLKRNGMQIDGKGIEILFVIMVLEKNTMQRHISILLYLGIG
jgi:hypothetical protein